MKLVFMKELMGDKVIQAICRTLLHSLWQGAILIIVTGIMLALTRKQKAALRYNILCGLFFLFLITVAVTFYQQVHYVRYHHTIVNFIKVEENVAPTAENELAITPAVNYQLWENIIAFFDRNASLVVAVWLLVLAIKVMRLLVGIGYVQHLTHYRTSAPSQHWLNRLEELCRKMGINGPVRMLESAIVKVPAAVGMLKPVILVPIGMLANLPVDQTEGILLHELAHIRRKDYFVNVLQNIAAVIFFFNPAVLWLSALIREEREHCCDDQAASACENKDSYLSALVSFQEWHLSPSRIDMAMAFAGRRQSLLSRVQRMVNGRTHRLNIVEKAIILCSVLIITAICMFPDMKVKAQQVATHDDLTINRVRTTQEGGKRTRLVEAVDKAGQQYKIVTVNKVVTEFYLNGEKKPVNEVFNHEETLSRIDKQLEDQRLKEEELARKRDTAALADWNRARQEGIRQEQEAAKRRREREASDKAAWEKAREAGEKDRQLQAAHKLAYEKIINAILADLVSDKLIANSHEVNNIWLGNEGFIVNDKKMSFDIYQRYKSKYLKSGSDNFKFNFPN